MELSFRATFTFRVRACAHAASHKDHTLARQIVDRSQRCERAILKGTDLLFDLACGGMAPDAPLGPLATWRSGNGLAFVIQRAALRTAALGQTGADDQGFAGIENSLAVVFATQLAGQEAFDPLLPDRISVYSCGTAANAASDACLIGNHLPVNISDELPHTVTVAYAPTFDPALLPLVGTSTPALL